MLAIGHGVEMRCHPLDGHNASDDATIHNVMTTSQFLMFPPLPDSDLREGGWVNHKSRYVIQ